MKKILLSIIYFLAVIFSTNAQILYGTTTLGGLYGGGIYGGGTINKFSPATNNLTVAYSFENLNAQDPYSRNFIQASDGKLYGMAQGAIFSFDPATSIFTNLRNLDSANGYGSQGSLVQASNGKLYGTTTRGGSNDRGVIFSFDPLTSSYLKLQDFNGSDGIPRGSLIQAADGKLYGTTYFGGSNDRGVIFSFDPISSTYTKLQDFDVINGNVPGTLVQANNGKLYGMTSYGGNNDLGLIFSFDPLSNVLTKLKDLDKANGGTPGGGLVQANDGKLYGMTTLGGINNLGVIFSIDLSGSVYTKLKDLDNASGNSPQGSLIQANDGKLYGLTLTGGDNNGGVIFSFNPAGSTFVKLKDLDNTNGGGPRGSLVQASNGKFYGQTSSGGGRNFGVIFSFDHFGLVYNKVWEFFQNATGTAPAGLVIAGNGKLYGETLFGGRNGVGTIYSFDTSTAVFTKLVDFGGTNGSGASGSLLLASDGKLYGTTSLGGVNNTGVIFSYDPVASVFTKLKDFDNLGGSHPAGSLMQASDGKLYGATSDGGINNAGVVFSFTPSTSTYTKLKDLDFVNGGNPAGSLVQGNDGKLYGTAHSSSSGLNVIFSFDPSTAVYTKLTDILDNSLAELVTSLTKASDGMLYGSAISGIFPPPAGVIFSFNPSTFLCKVVANFNFFNGRNPQSLMQASNGKLYGMTFYGPGADLIEPGSGVIFSFDLSSLTITKLVDFYGPNGSYPGPWPFVEANACTAKAWYQDADGDGYGNPNSSVSACIQPASYVADKTDCDDNNNAVHLPATWYQDKDGDGYGNPNSSVSACIQPAGYVADNTDCDDNNNAVHLPATWYQDKDGDGYGNPNITVTACSKPAGYVADNTDCDDNNNAAHLPATWYQDKDGDGYGNPAVLITACTKPAGYVSNNTDCDDNKSASHTASTWYRDKDRDGYGDPSKSIKACTKPAGYVANNTDCDDKNRFSHAPVTYYRDADRDGFGDPSSPISVCKSTTPAGYVRNAYDCNDHKKASQFWNERVLMCHNGISECVYVKEVIIRLCQGWTLGLCPPDCNNNLSKIIGDEMDNADTYSKKQPLPLQYKLSNYPNPFVRTSTIKYELPQDSKVSIKVYDVQGRTVATLVDENKKAGVYTVDFNAGHLSSGSMYYRIIATSKDQHFEQTNKMIQLR